MEVRMKALKPYWGYLVLAFLIEAWVSHEQFPLVAIAALSLADTYYFLFRVPVWCQAVTRDNKSCRENSRGILPGCNRRQHKWQRVQMTMVPRRWHELNRGLWASPKEGLATIGLLVSIMSTLVSLIVLLLKGK
jgi:hypothetical protein